MAAQSAMRTNQKEFIEWLSESSPVGDAVEFAEWISKNYYETDDDGLWYKWLLRSKKEDPSYTTDELYQLFLKSKQ